MLHTNISQQQSGNSKQQSHKIQLEEDETLPTPSSKKPGSWGKHIKKMATRNIDPEPELQAETVKEPELFGDDALPRPPGLQRIAKSQHYSKSTASSGSDPSMFQEMMQQQYELGRKEKMERINREIRKYLHFSVCSGTETEEGLLKVYKAGKRLLYVKRNKAISFGKGASKVSIEMEAKDNIQKSKIKWAIEGDENLKFFHGIINKKRSQMSIHGVFIDGDLKTDPDVVKDAFIDHFAAQFKQPANERLKLNISFTNWLSTEQAADMDRCVSRD
ncbi:hypothetical protein Tco_0862843 [Tanacetum coccineum]